MSADILLIMKSLRSFPSRVISSPSARYAVLTTVACVIAFILGSLLTQVSAIVAAITALISVRTSFHASMKEAFLQVIGTLIGAMTVFGLVTVFGSFSFFILGVSVFAAFVAARLMRLGDSGAISIAVTVVLVGGGNMDASAVEERLLGVVLGVLVALLISLYMLSGTPASRVLDTTLAKSERLASLLTEIGESLMMRAKGLRIPVEVVETWLDEAQEIQRELAVIHGDAEEAVTGSRWTPLMSRQEAEEVLTQVKLTEASAAIVVGMCRDLLIAAADTQPMPDALAGSLSAMFTSLAEVMTEQAEAAKDSPAETLKEEDLQDLEQARVSAAHQLKDLEQTAPLLLGGSLLQDSEKISRLMTGKQ